jgi:hypothetical protein
MLMYAFGWDSTMEDMAVRSFGRLIQGSRRGSCKERVVSGRCWLPCAKTRFLYLGENTVCVLGG